MKDFLVLDLDFGELEEKLALYCNGGWKLIHCSHVGESISGYFRFVIILERTVK